jgi:hypothetical protein
MNPNLLLGCLDEFMQEYDVAVLFLPSTIRFFKPDILPSGP